MTRITAWLGTSSPSRIEISDQEDSASESGMSTPAPKQEKKIKLDPSTVEDDDRLMVESNADEEDDEDEQLGEDEFVIKHSLQSRAPLICITDLSSKKSPTIL